MKSLLAFLITKAYAQDGGTPADMTFQVSEFGGDFGGLTFGAIVTNILDVLQSAVVVVATCIFIIGGFVFAISAGNEDKKSRGKDLMMGSLIGMGIVIAAKGIMNMVYFFVYGG